MMATPRIPLSRLDNNRRPSLGAPAKTRKSMAPAKTRKSIAMTELRRMSLAPSRATKPPRQSLQRNSVLSTGRASGLYPMDPRPVKNKVYMKGCVANLMQFLTANGFSHQITNLLSPTSRDYYEIVGFMYSRIDPEFCFVDKWEQDIPNLFRILRYPFAINKSSLVAVGSPHTWPVLLASLTWLMELLVVSSIIMLTCSMT